MDRSRLEAFSDGVFAVAITLLVLNLAVAGPGTPGHLNPPLLHQLGRLWPSFAAYVVSFFMIGIIWVNHHVLIRSFKEVDRTLLFLNLILVMFVVLIPFATATVADYRLSNSRDGRVAMVLYGLVFLGMSARLRRDLRMVAARRAQARSRCRRSARWAARARFVGGGGVYLIAIVVALFNASPRS